MISINSFNTIDKLTINNTEYQYFSLPLLEKTGCENISTLPFSLKILLENLLRNENNNTVKKDDIYHLCDWIKTKKSNKEISYHPARVLMQDFTGVPAIVDLSALRDAIHALGGNPERINPLSPVDLVIDHSVQVDAYGSPDAVAINAHLEFERNSERYGFLRWGQQAFSNFKVIPPNTGICHQVNLEFLAQTVWQKKDQNIHWAFPDTLVGTDSHTTMINGLGVLGWGVGGIEAEAAMLGQPISMLIPEVIGVQLIGTLNDGVTATDLVLTLTERLRKYGVVGKFVEYCGPGIADLSVADRATIANMAPEYGATCGFFPIDDATLRYLELSGRNKESIALVEAYAKAQGLWYEKDQPLPAFTDMLVLNLSDIQPSLAGPKRPQDRVELPQLRSSLNQLLKANHQLEAHQPVKKEDHTLNHGDIVIAAITSCTNTSNPHVLLAAGLLAKKAVSKGLKTKPWVKTSLAPGSQVVTRYLKQTGLADYLDQLGFNTVGYGCTTCIGNSGPLPEKIGEAILKDDLIVSAVLSGNRNFEGRIHPLVKANWLASPPLVVTFALIGTVNIDLMQDPIGYDQANQPVFLKDIWPSNAEINQEMTKVTRALFQEQYQDVFKGSLEWQSLPTSAEKTYQWQIDSTYIQHPPFFNDIKIEPTPIKNILSARILALFGDSITTDHISPAGSIKPDSPAGKYLQEKGVSIQNFNSYGARRGNHEVMMRGTFANIRIRNEMVEKEGGYTKYFPSEEIMTIYEAAMLYKKHHIPQIIVAGKEYGTGSSRDWAAKGPKLLGIEAVVAESFERIHRSNLIGMGIIPLQFKPGENRKTLELTGNETISILGLDNNLKPNSEIEMLIERENGEKQSVTLLSRIDTQNEIEYYRNGGILQYVLRGLLKQ